MQQTIVPTVSVAPAPTTRGRHRSVTRRLRRLIRNVIVAGASFVVVIVAASYVLMPGGEAMAATVEVGTDPAVVAQHHGFKPDYHDCPVNQHGSHSHDTEVIYGTISAAKGVHVSDVRVEIDGATRQLSRESAEIEVGGQGNYRAVVQLPTGLYDVKVTLVANGHRVKDTKSVRLEDDRAYNVSAKVRGDRIFSILPVSSY